MPYLWCLLASLTIESVTLYTVVSTLTSTACPAFRIDSSLLIAEDHLVKHDGVKGFKFKFTAYYQYYKRFEMIIRMLLVSFEGYINNV